MSPEQMQLLLKQVDTVKLAAEEAAKACGLPIAQFLPMPFAAPTRATDIILDLAKDSTPRNAGLLNFLTSFMPEMEPDRSTRQGGMHYRADKPSGETTPQKNPAKVKVEKPAATVVNNGNVKAAKPETAKSGKRKAA